MVCLVRSFLESSPVQPLDLEQRSLLAIAFKTLAGQYRQALHSIDELRRQVEAPQLALLQNYSATLCQRFRSVCFDAVAAAALALVPVQATVATLTSQTNPTHTSTAPIASATAATAPPTPSGSPPIDPYVNESFVFFHKMTGDYCRYLTEVQQRVGPIYPSTSSRSSMTSSSSLSNIHHPSSSSSTSQSALPSSANASAPAVRRLFASASSTALRSSSSVSSLGSSASGSMLSMGSRGSQASADAVASLSTWPSGSLPAEVVALLAAAADDPVSAAQRAYEAAQERARAHLPVTSAVRLALALNYSVFVHDVLRSPDKACELAKSAFDSAIAELTRRGHELDSDAPGPTLLSLPLPHHHPHPHDPASGASMSASVQSSSELRDIKLIMRQLRDNLTLWTREHDHEVDE